MKVIFFGDGEKDPDPNMVNKLAEELLFCDSDLPVVLLENIELFEFEVGRETTAFALVCASSYLFFLQRHGKILDSFGKQS